MKDKIMDIITKFLFSVLVLIMLGIFLMILGLVVYGCMVVWSYIF